MSHLHRDFISVLTWVVCRLMSLTLRCDASPTYTCSFFKATRDSIVMQMAWWYDVYECRNDMKWSLRSMKADSTLRLGVCFAKVVVINLDMFGSWLCFEKYVSTLQFSPCAHLLESAALDTTVQHTCPQALLSNQVGSSVELSENHEWNQDVAKSGCWNSWVHSSMKQQDGYWWR